ncbi:MAG TPA: family 43 glycosylhydrolase [Verrucomicrobiae bacterium]|nr:family 43 glycosylhydrolase [Verrucomicrobiae bacterium]
MKNNIRHLLTLSFAGLCFVSNTFATNPLILDQFTADPTARVFEGKIYLYPSHDIPPVPGRTRTNWFCMEDYHVFSSENLTDWKDHGVILNQTNVAWANSNGYSLWAPDCVFKNGKYYFYFPAPAKEGRGFRIGAAIADKPYGPFMPEPKPIEGVRGIDPCVLMDKDGNAYLFWAGGSRVSVAKLKDNLLELDSKPQLITNLPAKGLVEGPFAFERNGIYYLTYPHAQTNAERLEYSTSTNPMGPYQQTGVILDESASGCWTVQHSIVEYQGQWYLFYHDKDLSPDFDKNRSVRADYLYFNEDGTIKKVIPTLRGVGVVDAKSKIQIDRYSAISKDGVSVSFLDETNRFEGWKISLNGTNTWVRFNSVDFGKNKLKSVNVRADSAMGGSVQIRLDKVGGPVLAKVKIGKAWKIYHSKAVGVPTGIHDLVVTQSGNNNVELDWISFE